MGGGFFTLKKNVADFGPHLTWLYRKFDNRLVSKIINVFVPEISNAFELVKQLLASTALPGRDQNLFVEMQETLSELDEIDALKASKEVPPENRSFVKAFFKAGGDAGSAHQLPVHCVIAKSLQTIPLQSLRTYFLSANTNRVTTVREVTNESGFVCDYQAEVLAEGNFVDEYKVGAYYFKVMALYFKMLSKFESGINLVSLTKFKSLLEQKLTESQAKVIGKDQEGPEAEKLEVSVELKVIRQDGSTVGVEELVKSDPSLEPKTNVSDILARHRLFTFRIYVDGIRMSNSQETASIGIADSFLALDKKVVNLTKGVSYFDFFETHPHPFKELEGMKELLATTLLGKRLLSKCPGVRVLIPMGEKLDALGIRFPTFEASVTWFEKGFKIASQKAGTVLILWNEIQSFAFNKHPKQALFKVNLQHPKFFRKFSQSVLIFECSGPAVTDFFYPLQKHLTESGVALEAFEFQADKYAPADNKAELEAANKEFAEAYRRAGQFLEVETLIPSHQNPSAVNTTVVFFDFFSEYLSKTKALSALAKELGLNLTHAVDLRALEKEAQDSQPQKAMEWIQKVSQEGDKNMVVLIPYHFDAKKILGSLQKTPNLAITRSVALLDFQKYTESRLSDILYENVFTCKPLDEVIFACTLSQAERCDTLVFDLNKALGGRVHFVKGIKNLPHGAPLRGPTGLVCLGNQISDKQIAKKVISFRQPLSKTKLDILSSMIFPKFHGIFAPKIDYSSILEPRVTEKLTEIEVEIDRLQRRILPNQLLGQGEAVRLLQVVGWVRVSGSLDKVHFINLTAHHQTIEETPLVISTEEKHFEGRQLVAPKYPDGFSADQLKILVVYQSPADDLESFLSDLLLEVT